MNNPFLTACMCTTAWYAGFVSSTWYMGIISFFLYFIGFYFIWKNNQF